jgi:hypothetical protein
MMRNRYFLKYFVKRSRARTGYYIQKFYNFKVKIYFLVKSEMRKFLIHDP